jgi:hypothetical protein
VAVQGLTQSRFLHKKYQLLRYFTVFLEFVYLLATIYGGINPKTAQDRTLGIVISEIVSKKQYKTAVQFTIASLL